MNSASESSRYTRLTSGTMLIFLKDQRGKAKSNRYCKYLNFPRMD